MKAWLCLGSNQESPFRQLEKAIKYLDENCDVKVLKQGTAISTKPFGYKNQPDFANQLLQIETTLSAMELLVFLKNAEIELGRKPTFKWGPRVIDMDIVLYENEIIKNEDLVIPHPGIIEREYLLLMMNELLPEFIHPELKVSINTLYNKIPKDGGNQ